MLWGAVADNKVLVLIDSGTSHNFISNKITQQMMLKVEPTVPYWVIVGNGQRIKIGGVCRNLELQLQQLKCKGDFSVFAAEGEDVVLGMEWLENLGEVEANFKELTLKIEGSTSYVVKGDPSLCKGEVSAKTIRKELEEEEGGYLVECFLQHLETEVPAGITGVIEDFEDISQDPIGLPPQRRHDHAIVIKKKEAQFQICDLRGTLIFRKVKLKS